MGISAIILTRNEEKNIERCLESLEWCDEIIVVDDFSSDKTVRHAEFISASKILKQVQDDKEKLKIFKRRLDGDFGAQRNYGLEKAEEEWVLFIDADEVITEELKKEILEILKQVQDDITGYCIKRKDYFLGKWLQYGETNNVKFLRLAQKDAGQWQGRVHEIWKVEGAVGELENPILHYPHESISQFLSKINHYTDLVAQCWKEEGRVMHVWEIIVYPFGKFIQNYILRIGFLDGMPGLILALMMSFHSFLSRSKYWLATREVV